MTKKNKVYSFTVKLIYRYMIDICIIDWCIYIYIIDICIYTLKNVSPYNVEKVINDQYFFSNNATFPFDRRPENLMIIFDDCSFIFHYVVEFDTRNAK